MGVYDVPANDLLSQLAHAFKEQNMVQSPPFAPFVKTGQQAQRAPADPDWWYLRCASVLYRVFKDGPVGTESLRTYYGGRKNRGTKPNRHRKAGGKIIRLALQQLETAHLVQKGANGGRVISPQGQKLLNQASRTAMEGLATKVKKKRVFHKATKTESDVTAAIKRGKKEDPDKYKDKKKKTSEET
ncbi:MAG: 30S ribosomal protein S19e [Candidatus Diapherotrites archaeon]|nr:30S ribosomal protein S19e [Candidatus Diapherotrites archaeon]